MRFGLVTAVACLVAAVVHAEAAGTKIAVMAEDKLAAVSDLLTVELSHRSGVELVERAELDRVLNEQALSEAMSFDGAIKLGKLVGADGLLFVTTISVETQKCIEVQLVAVRPGLVIDSLRLPGAITDTGAAAALLAAWAEKLLPKLTVEPARTVRVSFLGVRAPVAGAGTSDLERELSLLLIHRMTHEPAWFVLERRRMTSLGEESAFAGETNAFWTGSFVLEGSLRDEGSVTNPIAVALTLKYPDGRVAATPRVEGARTNLPTLADELVVGLIESLKKTPAITTWAPAVEAGIFHRKAVWAEQAGLPQEALEAADASWALGDRSDDLWLLRVRSYALRAWPEFRASMPIYEPRIEPLQVGERLRYVSRALELFDDGVRQFRRPKGWDNHGVCAMASASMLLTASYTMQQTAGREEILRELRRRVRDTDDLLRHSTQGLPEHLDELKTIYAPYWSDTPEETIAMYRDLAGRDPAGLITYRGFYARKLIAWSPDDEARLDAVWKSFCAELAASSNVNRRLTGLFLASGVMDIENQTDAYKEQVKKVFTDARKDMIDGHIQGQLLNMFYSAVGRSTNEDDRAYWFEFTKYFFANDTSYASERTEQFIQDWPFTTAQAAEVAPLVLAYGERMKKAKHPPHLDAELQRFLAGLDEKSSSKGTATATLKFRKLWQVGDVPFLASLTTRGDPSGYLLRGRDLWFVTLHAVGPGLAGCVLDVNLDTLKTQIVPVPACPQKEGDWWAGPSGSLLVSDRYLVAGTACRTLVYDRPTSRWKSLDLPPDHGISAIGLVGDRVYAGSGQHNPFSAMWRFDAVPGDAVVQASSRRRPAETPLDDIPPYEVKDIFGSGGSQWVSVFRYSENSACELWEVDRGWKLALKTRNGIDAKHEPEGTLLRVGGKVPAIAWMANGTRTMTFLLGDATGQPALAGQVARWNFERSWSLYSSSGRTSDGKSLWMLVQPDGSESTLNNLVCFVPGRADPVYVPISLDDPNWRDSSQLSHAELFRAGDRLILAHGDALWFVSDRDLDPWLALPAATPPQ